MLTVRVNPQCILSLLAVLSEEIRPRVCVQAEWPWRRDRAALILRPVILLIPLTKHIHSVGVQLYSCFLWELSGSANCLCHTHNAASSSEGHPGPPHTRAEKLQLQWQFNRGSLISVWCSVSVTIRHQPLQSRITSLISMYFPTRWCHLTSQ